MKSLTKIILKTSMLLSFNLNAAIFAWDGNQCIGNYDPKKISKQQLSNSIALLRYNTMLDTGIFSYQNNEHPTASSMMKSLSAASQNKLDSQLNAKLTQLKQFKIPSNLEPYRELKINETKKSYKIDVITLKAYTEPKQAYNMSPATCQVYAKELMKGEQIIIADWEKAINQKIKVALKEGNTVMADGLREELANSKNDKIGAAKYYFAMFGLQNCNVDALSKEYKNPPLSIEKAQEKFYKQVFGKSENICEY